jgi:hypothetical protein
MSSVLPEMRENVKTFECRPVRTFDELIREAQFADLIERNRRKYGDLKMTVGIAAATANGFLSTYRNTAAPAVATPFIQLHTGDPGAAGTANVSVGTTTRNAITWNAPASGSMTLATLGAWTNGGTSETLTHVSLWTASTAGTFLQSFALTASQAWVSTNTFTISTFTVSFSPIAA